MPVNKFQAGVVSSMILALVGCDKTLETVDKAPRPVQVVTISQNNEDMKLSFSGLVESQKRAELSFRVPGTLQEVLVKMGDPVTKGQLLARLDPHDYEVNLAELKARLVEAKSTQRLAGIEGERLKKAGKSDAIAKVNLDRARSGYERATAAVEVVEQKIQQSRDALSYTELRAPYDGIIARRYIDNYEQALPGAPVFVLHQPERLQVVIDVPENTIGHFSAGTKAQVNRFQMKGSGQAIVTEIGSEPDPFKRTYSVKLKLLANNLALIPGQTVDVSLSMDTSKQQICLPYSAVTEINGQSSVFVADQDQARAVPVKHLEMRARQACITADLAPGEKVIVAGADYLKPDDALGHLLERVL